MSITITKPQRYSNSLIAGIRLLTRQLQLMLDKRHQRRQLASLSIEQLTDMGIDPADAQKEIRKPFWK